MQLGPLSSLMKGKYHSKSVKTGIGNSKYVFLEHSQEIISHVTIVSVTLVSFFVYILLLLFIYCFLQLFVAIMKTLKRADGNIVKFKFSSQPLNQGILVPLPSGKS